MLADPVTLCTATALVVVLAFFILSMGLPGGSLLFALFCCHRFGWGWENFVAEANTGRGPKIRPWMRFYCAWIVPAIVLAILLLGLWDKFGPKG